MAQDRTELRKPAAIVRRPAVAATVNRSAAVAASLSPAQALQRRLGNQGTQALISRSIAGSAPVSVTSPVSAQFARVSQPNDPAEIEARDTARKVVNMSEPAQPPAAKADERVSKPLAQRDAASVTAAPISSAVSISPAGGSPLPSGVRSFMEPRFGADFGNVRIHTGESAAQQSAQLSAHAFTVGEHVFFGRDQFQPQSAGGRELIAHELTHTVQQGAVVQRSEDTTVSQRAPVMVQRFGIGDALDWIADKANYIPGFRLLTIVLGVNPINMSPVDRGAANLLRAMLELIPIVGALIVQALDSYGIFAKVGAWFEVKVKALGLVGSALKAALMKFLDSLSWTDIFDLGGVWDRAKAIFTEPIDRLLNFGKSVASDIIGFVRQAILLPLAKLAEGTRGYDLLKAVLGEDPVTGQPVPRTAETLIGGFMKLIGQEDIWENIKKSHAIPRAWAWFQGALNSLMGFLRQIPTLFINALKSLEIIDLVFPWKAFAKIAGVFGGFALQFVSWAGHAVWNLLEIVFEVVSPGALVYLKKTGAALKSILKNPGPFAGNLVKAAKLGFTNFTGNFLRHLTEGLIDWLTGSLPGIYIPKQLTLAEIAKFAFSVLGLTWVNIRQKLVKVVGEPAMKAMETGFNIVVTVLSDWPAAAWVMIKDQLTNLKDVVIGGITDFVVDAVVKKAIPKLIAMFIPGVGFIAAIMSIYDTIKAFVQKISKLVQVVKEFVDSIVSIAGGEIATAAARVENALAGVLTLAINILAAFFLGNVTEKVKAIIEKIRTPVDKALDWLVNWIVTMAKKLFAKVFGKKDKDDKRDFRIRAKEELALKFQGKLTRDKMQSIVADVFAKYQPEGLKGIVAKHPSGHGSQYEAVLIASLIPVSTAEADFDIETADLDLGWGRTSATGILKAGSKTHKFGPHQNDETNHAEENLIADLNQNFADVAAPKSTGITNILVLNITRSPCGDMPQAHNCAKQIQLFVAKWKAKYLLEVEIRAASIYYGKFRKASREAIKKLVDSGIKFTAWDLVEEMGDAAEVSKETLAKLQKRIDSTKENLPDIIKVGAGE
ncbi:MAG: hypothetical protein QOJ84_352 [Bradyrhizobium sp.]|nr:hypothetical protein [Bradyrhizobium sp.]